MYQGDEVAAVAADTEEHAIDAARMVKVDYEVLPHLTGVDQALAWNAPVVFNGGNTRQGAASAAALGPGEVPVHLQVNGKRVDLMIEPRVTLLDALRMRADMTGNKRGCDRGACGACTMIVDGRPVYSCSTLAIEVQGKAIRTVDGLANGSTLHPLHAGNSFEDA